MRRLAAAALALPLAAAAPVCLQTYRIDHTDVLDNSTIRFVMRDGTRYLNRLPAKCPGLYLDPRGFSYTAIPGSDEICSNLVTITLNTSHAPCLLGAFVPEPKPAKG